MSAAGAVREDRLWQRHVDMAKLGGTPKGGIKRLTVSDEDKRVRDWFKAECEKLGCTVEVDEVGNMFATRPGKRKQDKDEAYQPEWKPVFPVAVNPWEKKLGVPLRSALCEFELAAH